MLFGVPQALIGMVHLGPLPGSPLWEGGLDRVREQAVSEARLYHECGYTALILENMHDVPYLKGQAGPETVAAFAVVAAAVRAAVPLPLGIQVLAAANQEALAIACSSGADFIRAEGFVFGHLADEGWIDACAGPLLRYRRQIGAEGVKIFADIKKKHSAHAATADVSLVETARAAEFFRADGVIVTGVATAAATDPEEVAAVAGATGLPVLVGSGVTAANLKRYPAASGLIVGSFVKASGHWAGALDPARVRQLSDLMATNRIL